MTRLLSAFALAMTFTVLSVAVSIMLEAAQSALNGFGFVQGFFGGVGLTVARVFSVQIFLVLLGALVALRYLPMRFAAPVLALVPALSFCVHFIVRRIDLFRLLAHFRVALPPDATVGLGFGANLLVSGGIAALAIVFYTSRHRNPRPSFSRGGDN